MRSLIGWGTLFISLILIIGCDASGQYVNCHIGNAAQYLDIDEHEIYQKYDPKKFHQFTNRSLVDYFKLTPDFVGQFFLNASQTKYPLDSMQILESGCGGGFALGQFMYLLPGANATCINKGGYAFVQSEDAAAFVRTNYFRIRINCKVTGNTLQPVLPNFYIMDKGITRETIQLKNDSFHYIYSVYALDNGKIEAGNIGLAVEQLIALLRIGGVASLLPAVHMPIVVNNTLSLYDSRMDTPISIVIVKTVHMVLDSQHHFTMLVFIKAKRASMVIKRCDPGYYVNKDGKQSSYDKTWGCFTTSTKLTESNRADVTTFFKAVPSSQLNAIRIKQSVARFEKILKVPTVDIQTIPFDDRIYRRDQYEYTYLQLKAFALWMEKFSDFPAS